MTGTAFETEVKQGTLTKDDVSAMRKCNRASFHWTAHYTEYRWVGEGAMRLTRRLPNAGPLDEQERSHEVAVACLLRDHADEDKGRDWGAMHCFDMTYGTSDEFRTVADIARPGDVLSLEWVKDNSNGYLRDMQGVKLHRDELSIVLVRNNRRLVFSIASGICPSNSARMIRSA